MNPVIVNTKTNIMSIKTAPVAETEKPYNYEDKYMLLLTVAYVWVLGSTRATQDIDFVVLRGGSLRPLPLNCTWLTRDIRSRRSSLPRGDRDPCTTSLIHTVFCDTCPYSTCLRFVEQGFLSPDPGAGRTRENQLHPLLGGVMEYFCLGGAL